MDYGAEPPEINSGRLWTGVGSAPTVAAAVAWQAVAAELAAAAAAYSSAVAELGTSWMGPSSMVMEGATSPKIAWLLQQALQSEQMAATHFQMATAFEAAFVGVTPPPMIAENRARLAALVATNFMGVNSPAIAATEAQYGEMWAQTSSTLYAYAGAASAVAGSIVPFTPNAALTDPAGMAAQDAAVAGSATQDGATSAGSMASQAGSVGSLPSSLSSVMSTPMQAVSAIPQVLQSLAGMGSQMNSGGMAAQFGSSPGSFGFGPLMGMGANVNASMGGSGGVGGGSLMSDATKIPSRLSVPPGWTGASAVSREAVKDEARLVSAGSSDTAVTGAPRGGVMPPGATGTGGSSGAMPAENKKRLPRQKVVLEVQ